MNYKNSVWLLDQKNSVDSIIENLRIKDKHHRNLSSEVRLEHGKPLSWLTLTCSKSTIKALAWPLFIALKLA